MLGEPPSPSPCSAGTRSASPACGRDRGAARPPCGEGVRAPRAPRPRSHAPRAGGKGSAERRGGGDSARVPRLGAIPAGRHWGCSGITPQGQAPRAPPGTGPLPRCCALPALGAASPWGPGVTLSVVGWRGPSSSPRGCGHPGVTDIDWGQLGAEQPEASPAAATCCGTPGLAGRRVPALLCRGADPALVAAGGRGGGSATNSSGQPQPRGMVQRSHRPR